jgi:1-deoxy-D-xylulose-5-phosphate reductoisomerase
MRIPIAHALAWPQRMEGPSAPLDLACIGRLDFGVPDEVRFPALRLARAAGEAGGALPAVLNAANEIAVAAFLDRRIGFLDIASIVESTLSGYSGPDPRTIEDVLEIDRAARRIAADEMESVRV